MTGGGGGGLSWMVAAVAVGGEGVWKKGLFFEGVQDAQDDHFLGVDGQQMLKMIRFGWLFERNWLGSRGGAVCCYGNGATMNCSEEVAPSCVLIH